MSVGFERAIDVQEERILHIRNNDAEDAALAARERAGMKIRMVVEFFGGLQHAGTRRGFDDFEIIEDARNRGRGDARLLGDGIKIHGQGAPFAHRMHLNLRQAHSIEN